MNVDSMFVASDIWPQLTGSDHCPSWADIALDSHLDPVLTLPLFSTRNIFTGRQNKLTGWLKSATVKPEVLKHTGAECSTAAVKQKPSVGGAMHKTVPKTEGKKVNLLCFTF